MGLTEAMEAGCRDCGGRHKTDKVGVLLLQQNHWEKFFPGNACSLRGCSTPAYSFTPSAPLVPPYCVKYNCRACLVDQITISLHLKSVLDYFPRLQIFAGIYRAFAGKSEERDFRIAGFTCINIK